MANKQNKQASKHLCQTIQNKQAFEKTRIDLSLCISLLASSPSPTSFILFIVSILRDLQVCSLRFNVIDPCDKTFVVGVVGSGSMK